jgi:phosphatidylinositol glycan class Z
MAPFSSALLAWRLALALSPGLLHPDELFQANEVLAHALLPSAIGGGGGGGRGGGNATAALALAASVPWEFADCAAPLRSWAAPLLLAGPPFALARAAAAAAGLAAPPAALVLAAQRIYLLGASLLAERALLRAARAALPPALGARAAEAAADVLALSWPVGVMAARPLSNALEACCITLLIALVAGVLRDLDALRSWRAAARAALAGAALAVGCFARFTAPLFALPAAAWAAVAFAAALRRGSARRFAETHLPAALAGAGAFAATAAAVAVLDAAAFDSGLQFLLAPLNALRYNADAANLARHGTHARWLHAAVNAPMMFGPLLPLAAFAAAAAAAAAAAGGDAGAGAATDGAAAGAGTATATARRGLSWRAPLLFSRLRSLSGRGAGAALLSVCAATAATGLAGLSVAPHQEPRFLLPLAAPLALLGGAALAALAALGPPGSAAGAGAARALRAWWAAFALFNLAGGLGFGFLHQGGVAPMTTALSRSLALAFAGADGARGLPAGLRVQSPLRVGLLSLVRVDERALALALAPDRGGGARSAGGGAGAAVLFYGTYA